MQSTQHVAGRKAVTPPPDSSTAPRSHPGAPVLALYRICGCRRPVQPGFTPREAARVSPSCMREAKAHRGTRVKIPSPHHLLWSCSIALATALAPLAGCKSTPAAIPQLPPVAADALRTPADFASIADRDERSAALFVEASRVFLHPRCSNCHPVGDSPLQGDHAQLHDPPVVRGPDDKGIPALACTSCHQDRNLELARVPGAPEWHLAPKSMAWVGKTPHALCEQIKDRGRNGGRNLDQIVEHVSHDALVGWGWSPGHQRTPAPGTQAGLGALVAAWVELGAACPRGEKP